MVINNLKELVNLICNVAIHAGFAINKHYKKKIKVKIKKDKTPVTKADLESNSIIIKLLNKIDNNIPILSEERLINWSERKNWSTYWLIDPLDGTREFINKNDEFTVNIALIDKKRPVAGVIYAPASSLLYFAYKNGGSFKKKIIKDKLERNFFSNAIKLKKSLESHDNKIKIICSRSLPSKKLIKWIEQNHKNYHIIKKGSSLKFCQLAEKKADFYPRFHPTNEWDIAAGHIILKEAGGQIRTLDDKEILYNSKKNVKNPYFIATK